MFLAKSAVKNWKNVNCYVYDETTSSTYTYVVAGWPGVAMSEDGDYYYAEIPARCLAQKKGTNITEESDFDLPHSPNTYVIFNGTNSKTNLTTQWPTANAIESQKVKLEGASHVLETMKLTGGKPAGWKTTDMVPHKDVVEATDVTKGSETPSETQFVKKGIYGDVDESGTITVQDVSKIQRKLAEFEDLTGVPKILADVDKDGKITVKDVTYIQVYLAEYQLNYAHTGETYGVYE